MLFPFQPTRPVRGAAVLTCSDTTIGIPFQPTRPVRARHQTRKNTRGGGVSTHAPRTGPRARCDIHCSPTFQPAPRTGARPLSPAPSSTKVSTHAPYGRASELSFRPGRRGFNPRAPYGAGRTGDDPAERRVSTHAPRTGRGDGPAVYHFAHTSVSTHAPRTGRGVFARPSWQSFVGRFNPRAPYGARHTSWMLLIAVESGVSTHAPRTGRGPPVKSITRPSKRSFNPRAPYGARPAVKSITRPSKRSFNPRARTGRGAAGSMPTASLFQPTRPVRGAAALGLCPGAGGKFQPTRPVRGAARMPCGHYLS